MTVRIELCQRHYGVHRIVKSADIPGRFSTYVNTDLIESRDECGVNEEKLLKALPKDFLPQPASSILLCIWQKNIGTGMMATKVFRSWAKYFDSYSLNVLDADARRIAIADIAE